MSEKNIFPSTDCNGQIRVCYRSGIEIVWAKVNGQVAMENKTFRLSEVKQMTCAALNGIDKEFFSKCEDHVLRLEADHWKKEGPI